MAAEEMAESRGEATMSKEPLFSKSIFLVFFSFLYAFAAILCLIFGSGNTRIFWGFLLLMSAIDLFISAWQRRKKQDNGHPSTP